MTTAAVDALRAEQARAKDLFASLDAGEWQEASGCDGWRIQDVAQHMASTFHGIADPTTIERGSSADVEANAEVPVQARREWSVDQVLAEYDEWSDRGIDALAAMQAEGVGDQVIPLANLGSHPMHILANAIAFDHYCHLRFDIGAAIDRAANLPHDELVLTATLEWMLAGIPQMCAAALEGCESGVNLEFTDLGVTHALAPGATDGHGAARNEGDPGHWTISEGERDDLPTAVSTAHAFVSWGTKRADWRDLGLELSDPSAESTLDAINVI